MLFKPGLRVQVHARSLSCDSSSEDQDVRARVN